MEEYDPNITVPSLNLGTIHTSKDLNDPETRIDINHPIYLMKFPYNDPLIDPTTFILFLASFNYPLFNFTIKTNCRKTKNRRLLDCRLNIIEYYSNGSCKKLFKIYFDSTGNDFYIQIKGTSGNVKYQLISVKKNVRTVPAYLFSNEFTFDYTSNKPYNLRYPLDAFHKMTKIFNGKNADDDVNQFTSLLFFRIAPFHPKTIRRLENSNPENDLLKIFTPLGGWLFIVKGKGIFTCKGEDVMMFSWFHPYFKNVFLKGTAIELDTTFKVLKPLKTVIPQLIIKNTGVPLCLLAGPSESTNLYSLFYESIRKIDINLFQKCLNMNYITDEHKCFISLKRKYNIVNYNCFAHLIRSVGASSPLGWLLKDILFTATKEEYERKLDQFKYTLIDTYNTFHCKDDSKDDKRYIKVGKILGVNVNGQPIEIEKSYAPLFERIERKIPTTTNFAESFHQKINSVAGNQHLNICSRLTLLANQILTRLTNIGQSSISNLRFFINSLKKKANEKVSNGTSAQSYSKENCSCSRSKYYSMMYDIDLPCIHMILNPKWDDISDLINEEFKNAQSFDLSLPKQGLSFDYLDTIQIDEENEEEEESSDISDSIIFECVKDDLEDYDTPIRYFIFHTYNQVKDYLKVDPIKVAETVIEVQKELLNTVEGRDLMQNDEQHYNAIWQVKTWERLNKLRK